MTMSYVSVEPHQERMGMGESVVLFTSGQSPRLTTNSMSGSLIYYSEWVRGDRWEMGGECDC